MIYWIVKGENGRETDLLFIELGRGGMPPHRRALFFQTTQIPDLRNSASHLVSHLEYRLQKIWSPQTLAHHLSALFIHEGCLFQPSS
jgi:hypothetical protein